MDLELKYSVREEYYQWLRNKVNLSFDYDYVARRLFSREFYWLIERDENRAGDGEALRYEFLDISGWCDEIRDEDMYEIMDRKGCTILELMIALAERWDKTLEWDWNVGRQVDRRFWEMFCNLGLDQFDNATMCTDYDDQIEEILDIFMDRTYAPNGSGGLFPLIYDDTDQRKIEIYDQLLAYIYENEQLNGEEDE